jgi:hypothetical protein
VRLCVWLRCAAVEPARGAGDSAGRTQPAACLSVVSLGRGVGTFGRELRLRRESQAVQRCICGRDLWPGPVARTCGRDLWPGPVARTCGQDLWLGLLA